MSPNPVIQQLVLDLSGSVILRSERREHPFAQIRREPLLRGIARFKVPNGIGIGAADALALLPLLPAVRKLVARKPSGI